MVRQINEYHPVIGHRYVPGIRARIPHEGGGYLIETNSSGFRCRHEFTKEKPGDTFRVLLFGDSFTAGDGVSNKFRFGDLLEQRITGLQVFNFGLSGTGTDQQYLAYESFGKDLDYDLLLICPLVQNIKRVASRYETVLTRDGGDVGYLAKPYYELNDGQLDLRSVPVPKGIFSEEDLENGDNFFADQGFLQRSLRGAINRYLYPMKNSLQKIVAYDPVREYSSPKSNEWKLMKRILVDWIKGADGASVVISPIPLYQHVEGLSSPANYRKRFVELVDETLASVHDPLDRFLQETKETRRECRFRVDQHFTALGHSIMADALEPMIIDHMKVGLK